jgi:hypothetical protein
MKMPSILRSPLAKSSGARDGVPGVAATHRHISDSVTRPSDMLTYPLYSTCIRLLRMFNVLLTSIVLFNYPSANLHETHKEPNQKRQFDISTIERTTPFITAIMEGTNLPSVNRFITTHNAEGKATFSDALPEALEWKGLPNGAAFGLGYTTEQYPVDFNNDKDLTTYQSYLRSPPGLVVPGGTVLRFVDCPPNSLSPMHRTVSLDYGVVLEGEIELVLDSGETRAMKRGDVAIQRGTNHAWKNPSSTQWARMMYVLQESKPLQVGDKALGEDYGVGMDGVPSSGKK